MKFVSVVVPSALSHVELTSSMELEDTLATDLMMGLDNTLTEDDLMERLHMRKLEEYGVGNGVENIDQSVFDDCLLGTDRKDMMAQINAEKTKEGLRKNRSKKINDLVKKMKPKLKKSKKRACKVTAIVSKKDKHDKRWWQ